VTPFPCNRCGACCRNVHLAIETQFLDRGDGCCKHYDEPTNLCSIYDDRPSICRVDEQYLTKYQTLVSWEQFVSTNLEACYKLALLPYLKK
jgi:hypothetical protein